MEFTQEQLELIQSEDPQIEFELKNEEVLAFIVLAKTIT
jgi:hypothetical protein